MGVFNDLTGQKFNMLTVVCRGEDLVIPSSGKRVVRWKCLCDCQVDKPEEERKYVLVTTHHLKSGHTKSCGCLLSNILYKRNKEAKTQNTFDLSGDIGIGYTYAGKVFYFDLEDYDIVKQYKWHINTNGYVATQSDGKYIQLHRLLMKVDDSSIMIDHINHMRHDCRRSNLRLATSSQNMQNRKIFSNNTSGVTGVYYQKNCNKWGAVITIDNKTINLGYFDSKDDAIYSRRKAEMEYFGDYRYQGELIHGR